MYKALYPGAGLEVFEFHKYTPGEADTIVIMTSDSYQGIEAGLYSLDDVKHVNLAEYISKLRQWENNINPMDSNIPFPSRHDGATIVRIRKDYGTFL